jgi:hypothetical protein
MRPSGENLEDNNVTPWLGCHVDAPDGPGLSSLLTNAHAPPFSKRPTGNSQFMELLGDVIDDDGAMLGSRRKAKAFHLSAIGRCA